MNVSFKTGKIFSPMCNIAVSLELMFCQRKTSTTEIGTGRHLHCSFIVQLTALVFKSCK